MNYAVLTQQIYDNFMAGAILAGVPLVVALGLGLIIAVFQAATQIQDQSLPALIKVVAICIVLIGFGYSLSVPLFDHTRSVFASFHAMTR